MTRTFIQRLCVAISLVAASVVPSQAQTVSLTPAGLGFGNQAVGTTSASKTVTLKNTSTTKTLNITGISTTGDYPNSTTCGSSLAPSATCTITVSFAPAALGAIDGAITVVDNATPATQVVNLTGSGVVPLTLAPTSLTFAATAIGKTTAAKTVTLTNSANALTMGTLSVSGDYTISATTCTGTIAASKTCTVSVTFTPSVAGAIAGVLTIPDSASGSPQLIPLSGTGTGTVTNPITFTPGSLTFASQTVGTTSASQTLTLKNTGTTAITVSAVTVSGDYGETNTCKGKSIAAGKTCAIKVSFSPSATGTLAGAVTVTDGAATSPQVVALTGTGASALTLAPPTLAFTGQVGITGTPQTATLTNNTAAAITISNLALSGDYTQTNTCAGVVGSKSSCTFSLTFAPLAGGTIDGALTISTSASASPLVLSLTGSASRAPIARYGYEVEYSAYTPGLVVGYAINPLSGGLRTVETLQLPSDNYGIVVHPSNKFLYMPDGSGILGYGIAANGMLAPLAGSPYSLAGGSALRFTANGKFGYTNQGAEYSVNATTGALTSIGSATVGDLPYDVAITPSGTYVYIPNFNDGTISAFSVNQTTGVLTAVTGSPFTAGDSGPSAVVVSPNGKNLFVANASTGSAGSVSVFSIAGATGALTAATGSPFGGSGAGNGIAVDPTGHYLYVASNGITAYSINQTTAALTAISVSPYVLPAAANGVTVDPTGRYVYASIFGNLSSAQTSADLITFALNPVNGELSQMASQGVDGNQGENFAIATGTKPVVYTPQFAYAANQGSKNISEYSISDTTGALTALTGSPLSDANGPQLIAATPSGAFVYTGNGNNTISEYAVNAATGALTLVSGSPLTGFGSVNALVVDPTSSFLLVLDSTNGNVLTYSIGPKGALTALSSAPTPTATSQTVALDPTGTIAILTSLTAMDYYQVDAGVLAPLKAGTATSFPVAAAFDQSSQYAFVAENTGNAVATYSVPFAVLLSSANTGNGPKSVLAEPSGKYVYVANAGDGTISAYSLNNSTGALTQIGTAISSGAGADSLSVSNDGKYLYATNNGAGTVSAFSISSNGSLTSLGTVPTATAPTAIVTTGTWQ